MTNYKTKKRLKQYWDKKESNYCFRKVRKGLRGLKFDILKRKGKPIKETIRIEIWVEEDGKLEDWTEY